MVYSRAVTLGALADRLGCRLQGDRSVTVTGIATLDEAGPADVTFLANPKYRSRLATTRAAAVIVGEDAVAAPCALLRTPDVYLAFAHAVAIFRPAAAPPTGISPHAAVDSTAEIGPDVSIGAFAAIGAGARIGARTIIEPHAVIGQGVVIGPDGHVRARVSIRDGVVIGARVVIQDGAVIGSDGFGFARRADGSHQKIPQHGAVVLEDDVEVGALVAIDRPAVGETRIGAGTKIDNLVQIAHGVRIGRHTLLAAQVGIAGSTVLEDAVTMAGQSGASGHLTIGRGAIVGAKSAVTKNVAAGEHVAGVPAASVRRWRETTVLARRLPEFVRAVASLRARLEALEARLAGRAGREP
jgi:UDP-3-O-[3-hydroxymyristoyl] glucosamine N-acyltransferase